MRRYKWVWLCGAGLILALIAGAWIWHVVPFSRTPSETRRTGQTVAIPVPKTEMPRMANDKAPESQNALVATVNGEPIYEKDISFTPPDKSFGVDAAAIRQMKLDRKIRTVALRQFLEAQQVTVADDVIDQTVAELKKNPPSAGCACCRYASLDQFMQDNYFTLDELRQVIRNNEGLKQYAEAQWEKTYPEGEKRSQLLQKEREATERDYVRASHIFFNTFQQPDFQTAPDRVRAEARKKADAVLARLQKGEAFQSVARDVSEDVVTKPKGGDLGCISKDAFGKEFAAAVSALKPGARSDVVESPWGCHIILRDSLTEADVADILKSEYTDRIVQETFAAVKENMKVEPTSGAGDKAE